MFSRRDGSRAVYLFPITPPPPPTTTTTPTPTHRNLQHLRQQSFEAVANGGSMRHGSLSLVVRFVVENLLHQAFQRCRFKRRPTVEHLKQNTPLCISKRGGFKKHETEFVKCSINFGRRTESAVLFAFAYIPKTIYQMRRMDNPLKKTAPGPCNMVSHSIPGALPTLNCGAGNDEKRESANQAINTIMLKSALRPRMWNLAC
jgi:hypothetical protein